MSRGLSFQDDASPREAVTLTRAQGPGLGIDSDLISWHTGQSHSGGPVSSLPHGGGSLGAWARPKPKASLRSPSGAPASGTPHGASALWVAWPTLIDVAVPPEKRDSDGNRLRAVTPVEWSGSPPRTTSQAPPPGLTRLGAANLRVGGF